MVSQLFSGPSGVQVPVWCCTVSNWPSPRVMCCKWLWMPYQGEYMPSHFPHHTAALHLHYGMLCRWCCPTSLMAVHPGACTVHEKCNAPSRFLTQDSTQCIYSPGVCTIFWIICIVTIVTCMHPKLLKLTCPWPFPDLKHSPKYLHAHTCSTAP